MNIFIKHISSVEISNYISSNFCFSDRPQFVAYHISIGLIERHRNDVTFEPVVETIPSEKRAEFAVSKFRNLFSQNIVSSSHENSLSS